MNAATVQLRKELALVRPVWLAGLGLGLSPLVLQSFMPWTADVVFWLALLYPACVLPAMEIFGREFSGGTFSMLMAQPQGRRRLWWGKVRVLAWVVGSVIAVFWVSSVMAAMLAGRELPGAFWAGTLAVAFTAGGFTLFFSLWARQGAGVFWLSVLTPLGVMGVLSMVPDRVFETFLAGDVNVDNLPVFCAAGTPVVLAAVAWVLAYRKILVIQDVEPLDREIQMPQLGWGRAGAARGALKRTTVWRQLVVKELRLQQGNVLVVVVFAVVMAVVFAVTTLERSGGNRVLDTLRAIWVFVWFLVPVLVGAVAVADERRLGVHDWQLVLPVSRRRQWWVKAGVCYVVALVLGVLLPAVIELALFQRQVLEGEDPLGLLALRLGGWIFSTTLALYASTLSRHVMQAISAAALLGLLGALLAAGAEQWAGGGRPSPMPLMLFVSGVVLLPTLLVLGQRNHGVTRLGSRLAVQNAATITGSLALSAVLTAGVWHRVWEAFIPEPVAGPALVAKPGVRAGLKHNYGTDVLALTPDGRLWTSPIHRGPMVGGGEWWFQELGQGSIWVDAARGPAGVVAVRLDGTLWGWGSWFSRTNAGSRVGYEPRGEGAWQIGTDTDWSMVAAGIWHVVGLKRDGTLWGWGDNRNGQLGDPGELTSVVVDAPVPLPGGTNCVLIGADVESTVAARRDGSVWLWRKDSPLARQIRKPGSESGDSLPTPRQVAQVLDPASLHRFVHAFMQPGGEGMVIDAKGMPFMWMDPGEFGPRGSEAVGDMRLDSVCSFWSNQAGGQNVVGVGTDGSLWRWRLPVTMLSREEGTRVGQRSDWLSVAGVWDGYVGMTADGGLWICASTLYRESARRARSDDWLPRSLRPRLVMRLGGAEGR